MPCGGVWPYSMCLSHVACCRVSQPAWELHGDSEEVGLRCKMLTWCLLCLRRAAVSGGAMELRASPYTSLLLLVGLTVGVAVAVARNLGECLSHIDRCCGIMVLIDRNMDTWKANGRSAPDKSGSNVYWTVHHCNSWRMKDQLDVNCYFISLIMCSTCFGH